MSRNDKKIDKNEIIFNAVCGVIFIGFLGYLFLKGEKDDAILMVVVMGLMLLFLAFIAGAISLAKKDTAEKMGKSIGERPANIIRMAFIIFWIIVGVIIGGYWLYEMLGQLAYMLGVILQKIGILFQRVGHTP